MKDSKRSSSGALIPTGSGMIGPAVHGKLNTLVPTVAELTAEAAANVPDDDVPIEELQVSVEMKRVLKKAAKRPNFITISYIGRDGQIQTWCQTRRYPGAALDNTIRNIHTNAANMLGGRSNNTLRRNR